MGSYYYIITKLNKNIQGRITLHIRTVQFVAHQLGLCACKRRLLFYKKCINAFQLSSKEVENLGKKRKKIRKVLTKYYV
jgi:hypothetical protein